MFWMKVYQNARYLSILASLVDDTEQVVYKTLRLAQITVIICYWFTTVRKRCCYDAWRDRLLSI